MRNGDVSFWQTQLAHEAGRPALTGDTDCDIAIVGGGLTGLWAAYYLRRARPDARIVVIESRFCGFGASGRNGGWLSAEVPGNRRRYAQLAAAAGHDGAAANRALTATLEQAVDEVLARIADEDISCDAVKSGVLFVARCRAQAERLRGHVEEERALGATGIEELTAAQLAERVSVAGAVAGSYSPHCARVQPAALTRGVARAVQASGVRIVEGTTATDIAPRRVATDHGTVRAETILICVEGFTTELAGSKRALLPMNSSMVVTEPLPESAWGEIGWSGAELMGEMAHAYTYAQRTADGRIALGGRGVPYRYGSGIDHDGRTQPRTASAIATALHERFPVTADIPIAHAWCGVLGVHRDWSASITYDPSTGIGAASGYVGSGLTTTNVAARTLRDLVLGDDTDLTRLPWVGHTARRWEFEPLRYLGVATMYAAYRSADARELRSDSARTDIIARVADRISGRA